jgi:hypothetical protein
MTFEPDKTVMREASAAAVHSNSSANCKTMLRFLPVFTFVWGAAIGAIVVHFATPSGEEGVLPAAMTTITKSYGCIDDASSIPVITSDVTLVPPNRKGPIIAPIVGYNWRKTKEWRAEHYELPIYQVLDRDQPDFWDYVLDELLLSRVNMILLHGRGCWDPNPGFDRSTKQGTGDMCPRLLTGFVEAVKRAGVEDVVRVGMWDDTGMHDNNRNFVENTSGAFDLGNEENWKYFWDHNIEIWFDTIPPELWYRIDGKPVIANWNANDLENHQGNASRLLSWLKSQFQAKYGTEPYFILDETWLALDTTVTEDQADGKHGWFRPPPLRKPYTYREYNGMKSGVVVPGFRDPGTTPGCGERCRELVRNGGDTVHTGLKAGSDSDLIILEGWTDMIESAGFYRSSHWSFPSQYINIVREYADPEPETLLFQAEGADRFHDTTPSNLGGQYSDRSLDVGALSDNTGWFVGWTEPEEWLEYQEVRLGCGRYRFSARVAKVNADEPARIRLAFGDLPTVIVPDTGGQDQYDLVHLGEVQVHRPGNVDLRIVFETGGINLDWFFMKRIHSNC